jgi:carbonic anhydrase
MRFLSDKSIAVVAFLVELGQANSLFTSVFSSISAIATPGDATLTGPLSFDDLENHLANNNVFRYNGSLTTPPCSQGVDWIISAKPLYIDADTYIRVKDVVKFNSRYTQNTLGQINLLQNAANELNAA